MHLVALMVNQLEALQDHADRKRRLMHRKATANTGALAIAERLPGIDRTLGFGLAAEIFRVERVGIGPPHRGIAMQRQHQHRNEGVLSQPEFAADGLVLQRRNAIGRSRRPQPQRLLQDLRNVGQLRDLLIGRPGINVGAEHPVDFLIGLLEHLGMFQQCIERARQQSARGLVSRDQERIDLVADVDVVELFAGGTVDAGHHGPQHILLVGGGVRASAPLGNDLVDHLVHERDIGGEIAPTLAHPQILQGKTADHHDGLERTHQ